MTSQAAWGQFSPMRTELPGAKRKIPDSVLQCDALLAHEQGQEHPCHGERAAAPCTAGNELLNKPFLLDTDAPQQNIQAAFL